MKRSGAMIFLLCAVALPAFAQSFRAEQLQYPRVQAAYQRKEKTIQKMFKRKNLAYPPRQIFLRAFKKEKRLELWVQSDSKSTGPKFRLLKKYPFCVMSGRLGPKRRQGDKQIPEGFYTIDRFNPESGYHLSLKVSYPNDSDRLLGGKKGKKLGGDIFIHGGCGSSGCIPLTNDKMEELYLIAVEARSQGQEQIPIHIFPTRLDAKGMRYLEKTFAKEQSLIDFWKGLERGFLQFENQNRKNS